MRNRKDPVTHLAKAMVIHSAAVFSELEDIDQDYLDRMCQWPHKCHLRGIFDVVGHSNVFDNCVNT